MKLNTPVISVAEMRAADRYTIEKGTPSKELMRRAAQGIFDSFDYGWQGMKTLIVCGSGNNGGDGYALAEIMKDHGFDVTLMRLTDKFSEDGKYYYDRCRAAEVTEVGFDGTDMTEYNVIVDCILGTGFSGAPRETVAAAIEKINEARRKGAYVISADINSGMNGDTGEAELAVKSNLTVSIGYYKHGFFRSRCDELIDKLVNVDIGIELPAKDKDNYKYITLREMPELKDSAAEWFHSKWSAPKEAYLECMDAYLNCETEYGWYLCLDGDKIVGGLGVIENDFHDRKDLSPNVCAVYTEPEYRGQGIAGNLLSIVVDDMRAKGISPIYLLTNHTGFYERYGWKFLCLAQGDGEREMSRMYIHR